MNTSGSKTGSLKGDQIEGSRSKSLNEQPTPSQHFGISYLFLVVACWAVGLAMAANPILPNPLRLLGVGLCVYWIAKCFFVLSVRFESPVREVIFFVGFLIYIASVCSVVQVLLYVLFIVFFMFAVV